MYANAVSQKNSGKLMYFYIKRKLGLFAFRSGRKSDPRNRTLLMWTLDRRSHDRQRSNFWGGGKPHI